jgi:hypothetical protein
MSIAILKTQAKSKILSPNISLKESSLEDSQISSNDETSLNNNIQRLHPNFKFQLHKQLK